MSLELTAASTDGAFTSIPIIDLGNCGTPEGRLATAYEIRDACTTVGFFYIQNHGISQPCQDKVFAAAQTYFSLPMETKMKLHQATTGNFNGYNLPLDSNIDPSNNSKGDFREGFRLGWEELEAKACDEKRQFDGGTNVWPSDYPEFRDACLQYYHAGENLGKTLFQLFALALELPETYFNDVRQNATAAMRVLYYPTREGHPEIDDKTFGIGAHTDFECFTILWQQPGIQALQIMNSEKKWIDAPAIKDALVINIGDQFAVWTNDVFKSTVHRAVNKSGKERYSIALFFGTDYHVSVEPIPSCVSPDRPAKYSPITAGEHVKKRLRDAYRRGSY